VQGEARQSRETIATIVSLRSAGAIPAERHGASVHQCRNGRRACDQGVPVINSGPSALYMVLIHPSIAIVASCMTIV